jgi:hypothetical protein
MGAANAVGAIAGGTMDGDAIGRMLGGIGVAWAYWGAAKFAGA